MTGRSCDFDNLLAVLRREAPKRPTLFEFYLNDPLYERLAGSKTPPADDPRKRYRTIIRAFRAAGYDYTTLQVPLFEFPAGELECKKTYSINTGGVILDRPSFEAYIWPDPDAADYAVLDDLAPDLPAGMKFIVCGPCGVLENVIRLVGYENLCYMMADDDELADLVFESVGARLVRYYEHCARHESVGALISNDDWGFKTQTMISPAAMHRYVFPWHAKIVETIHGAGKPVILHSCGNLEAVMDVIIDDLKYDGKHSFEDAIQPVEEAYEEYGDRIAVLGGIDLDFVCRATPEAVYGRSKAMLERAGARGGYAHGTGNSVPEYVPHENYFAMTRAALE